MSKRTGSRLDNASLVTLGAERLAAILLEEAAASKPLKARLQAALAASAGPDEIMRLIDRRLDVIAKSRSGLGGSKARELGLEIAGINRSIVSELSGADPLAAVERLIRISGMAGVVLDRLYENSAVLDKAFGSAEDASIELAGKLDPVAQCRLIPMLHAAAERDRYGELRGYLGAMIRTLSIEAASLWMGELEKSLAGQDTHRPILFYLQSLARHMGDVDAYIRFETAKPESHRDTFSAAELLLEAGRFEEALLWVRQESKGVRPVERNGRVLGYALGTHAHVSRRLEAEILDALRRRSEAQALRWEEFAETFDPGLLKIYIGKLDDFAEFEELDRAFALVDASDDIVRALDFFVAWPRLDRAAALVLRSTGKWSGWSYEVLAPAADALSDDHPFAATVLYRVLLSDILDRGQSGAYPYAAGYLAALWRLSETIDTWPEIGTHRAYIADIVKKHGRKYGFWSLVPKEFKGVSGLMTRDPEPIDNEGD
ncbi:MAG: hypothetical protein KDJ87_04740 [Rhizobiaceae bacterium]|nr:hypothetical protein [Rhizobiaceae bacterium]